MYVNNKSLVRAMEKAGLKIETTRGRQSNDSMRQHGVKDEADLTDEDRLPDSYRVVSGDRVTTWRADRDGKTGTVHCSHLDDKRDLMTDYFPGFYPRSIKDAVSFLTGK